MNYDTLSPETRKAYIETCERILAQKGLRCSIAGVDCNYCPACSANNNEKDCTSVKGGCYDNTDSHPAIRAYFERTLKELRAMDTKMTKEEAKELKTDAEAMLKVYNEAVETFKYRVAEYQAIIDAPEVDTRVGKLFVEYNSPNYFYFKFKNIGEVGDYISENGVNHNPNNCRPVTREEALAMVYEPEVVKSCGNCGNLTGYCIKRLPKVCDNWIPK